MKLYTSNFFPILWVAFYKLNLLRQNYRNFISFLDFYVKLFICNSLPRCTFLLRHMEASERVWLIRIFVKFSSAIQDLRGLRYFSSWAVEFSPLIWKCPLDKVWLLTCLHRLLKNDSGDFRLIPLCRKENAPFDRHLSTCFRM